MPLPDSALLLDAWFEEERGIALLFEGGKTLYDPGFKPYFYLKPKNKGKEPRLEAEGVKPVRLEWVERTVAGEKRELLKVYCGHPSHVPKLSDAAKAFGDVFEYKIPFARRYLIDKGLVPCNEVAVEAKGDEVKSIRPGAPKEFKPRMLSFDIETYNKRGLSDAAQDACIMIGTAGEKGSPVFSFNPKEKEGEKKVLEEFASFVQKEAPDLLCTYNGDAFDLPYLKQRAQKTRAKFFLGAGEKPVTVKSFGARPRSRVTGRVHFDVFNAVAFSSTIGALKSPRLTLEKVFEAVFGKEKKDIEKERIWEYWEKGGKGLQKLKDYCESDAVSCHALAKHFLPLEVELSRVTGLTLFDASRATSGQLVEALLLREAFKRSEVAPRTPDYAQVQARLANPIKGAFVKMPEPGVYENIVVFDFRSLYPSIIVAHNIDPFTLNCECCGDKAFKSPQGHRFCRKQKGLIPFVLEKVLEARTKAKQEMKKASGKERRELDARQWALKILANSFYGYTVYSRSRWYSRECGESTTAWARQYIHDTIGKAEKDGFKVLYGDTDSIFLRYEAGEEKKIKGFQDKVNAALPEKMELELEDFYPRGIFVSKKQEEKGAKKKYALVNKDGKIKIRGFELVRRDWSPVARKTQRRVLEILLKEGSIDKAVAVVRQAIKELRKGETPLKELGILTRLRKRVKDYAIESPEVAAVVKARKAGKTVPEGSLVEFVITRQGKSISGKARLLEEAKDYDADYYVNKQVLPAVLKILSALGFDEKDIKLGGKQKGLNNW